MTNTTRCLCVFLLCCWVSVGFAQRFDWALHIQGTDEIVPYCIVADHQGNVVVGGRFTQIADFDPGPEEENIDSHASSDYFIARYDSTGALVWVYQQDAFQNTSVDRIYEIEIDDSNNIYAAGYESKPESHMFLLKLDQDGNRQWKKDFYSLEPPEANDIHIDESGHIYVGGIFASPVDFDPGPDTLMLEGVGTHNAFVLKLDSTANLIWAKKLTGTAVDNAVVVNSLATDTNANVYVTGGFTVAADLDPGESTYILQNPGEQDVFILKLDPDGNFTWAKQIRNDYEDSFEPDYGVELEFDALDQLYVVAPSVLPGMYDPGGEQDTINFPKEKGALLLKMDTDGRLIYMHPLGGDALMIDVLDNGDYMVSGRFAGTTDFDPRPDTYFYLHRSPQDYGPYISRFDSTGRFLWAREAKVVISDADRSGNVFGTYWFGFNVEIETDGADTIFYNDQSSDYDLYVTRYKSHDCSGQEVDYMVQDQLNDTGAEPNQNNAPVWKSPAVVNYGGSQPNQDWPLEFEPSSRGNNLHFKIRNIGCNLSYNSKIELYYSLEHTGLLWPVAWNDVYMDLGGESILVGDKLAEFEIPPLYRNDTWEGVVPKWNIPIDPTVFPDGTAKVHILLRIVSPVDEMFIMEGNSILENVHNNNNLAWRVMHLKY